jgi:hypothetical protein
MDEFAVNLASERVDDEDLKILVVGKAFIEKMLRYGFAMRDRVGIGFELQSNPISHRDTVFHIEEKFLHGSQPWFVLLASQSLFLNNARNEAATCRCWVGAARAAFSTSIGRAGALPALSHRWQPKDGAAMQINASSHVLFRELSHAQRAHRAAGSVSRNHDDCDNQKCRDQRKRAIEPFRPQRNGADVGGRGFLLHDRTTSYQELLKRVSASFRSSESAPTWARPPFPQLACAPARTALASNSFASAISRRSISISPERQAS